MIEPIDDITMQRWLRELVYTKRIAIKAIADQIRVDVSLVERALRGEITDLMRRRGRATYSAIKQRRLHPVWDIAHHVNKKGYDPTDLTPGKPTMASNAYTKSLIVRRAGLAGYRLYIDDRWGLDGWQKKTDKILARISSKQRSNRVG